ncbi:hypothetical protein KIN20_036104 [Parelaphostrongylus tenuis]|uniref:Uncharacterized protein n=1 Tax=Parelaphostrongylus tenuis TaxID=148309 RepID=A0AAD5WK67_PARTN|nr:hypothetical protein KIN20_036104 [Parelaphostrongylus tenuis]
MKSSSAQKKRKSDVHFDTPSPHPIKKDRPWYTEEASLNSSKLPADKSRRRSLVGLGKGLLKKMRSSSALKDHNSRETTMALMSVSTSTIPVFKQAPLNSRLGPMPEDQSSQCESSAEESSGSSEVLARSFRRNKDLVRLVGNVSTESQSDLSSEQASTFGSEALSSENISDLGSVASLCTPSRDFGREKTRGSSRSMPPESNLIRGLCNSAVRRTMSSVSDSLADPQRFTPARSIQLREKLALSASMADLPEEEVTPVIPSAKNTDELKTPRNNHEGSSRRTSIVWSTLRSKSRIFGSKKGADGTPTGETKDVTENSAGEGNVTPSGRSLRRMSASSASIQKKVSSALKRDLASAVQILMLLINCEAPLLVFLSAHRQTRRTDAACRLVLHGGVVTFPAQWLVNWSVKHRLNRRKRMQKRLRRIWRKFLYLENLLCKCSIEMVMTL